MSPQPHYYKRELCVLSCSSHAGMEEGIEPSLLGDDEAALLAGEEAVLLAGELQLLKLDLNDICNVAAYSVMSIGKTSN